jgi:two-component system chemotaxis response regulator CheB
VEVLAGDPAIEIAGEAGDGKTAIELCRALRPDVVTLDMVLPVVSGLAVTEYIMAYCPTPILIVSASSNRGDLYKTYDALAAGALDVLEKPKANESNEAWERKFVSTIKLVSRINVITHMRGRSRVRQDNVSWPVVPDGGIYRLVAIGASTGGPAAAVEILRDLPANFPLPILMVIHISDTFGEHMAEWLDSQSQIRVSSAVDGEPIPEVGEARVILAAPGRHMEVWGGRIRLSNGAERHSCRPSVDVLFESIAREMGAQSIACLLTGMGKDGAQGLFAIRRAGGRTIAQNEASSIIFGMPQEAIRIGAAERVLALNDVVPVLTAFGNECKAGRVYPPSSLTQMI